MEGIMRVELHSRAGNVVVAGLGIVYAVAATMLLIYYVVDTWGAAGFVDRALQVALLFAAIAGGLFVAIGWSNLRRGVTARRGPRHHPAGAAVAR
jgi:hypothetical protein